MDSSTRALRRALLLPLVIALASCTVQESSSPAPTEPEEHRRIAVVPDAGSPSPRCELEGDTRVVLLGTGTPLANPDRSGPAVAVVVKGSPYIVDFGPGVVRRAATAARRGVVALEAQRLTRAFATHLHSDHTAGYSDLILTPWVLDRNEPLEVYGPSGLETMTDHLLKAYSQDIEVRLSGQPIQKLQSVVVAHDVEPGVVYQDERVKVEAFTVNHGMWKVAFGYRFETADRTVVISGDTSPSDNVVKACSGCDVLVHEVYSYEGFARRSAQWQAYHSASHTSSIELGAIAAKAAPKLLVLYHQLHWGGTKEGMLADIGQRFRGEVVYGNDLDVF